MNQAERSLKSACPLRVFVYEFITGGGLWQCPEEAPAPTLLAEGGAMLMAMAADFAALPGIEAVITRDVRLGQRIPADCTVVVVGSAEEESQAFARLARTTDWTVLIAPESNGILLNRARLVERVGGRLLSPSPACIEIAGCKQETAEVLSRSGIPVPRGGLLASGQWNPPAGLSFPVVVKPVDGCGSSGVQLICDEFELAALDRRDMLRREEFILGLPASVAVLCGPAGNHALPACEQRLSANGRFHYLGGRLPLDPGLDARARRLALAAVSALPEPRGYVGIDLVLGEGADGIGDRVIEVNPRLTTSYVGLRAASRTNLAAGMLAVAEGREPDLCFSSVPVEFQPDGTIDRQAS